MEIDFSRKIRRRSVVLLISPSGDHCGTKLRYTVNLPILARWHHQACVLGHYRIRICLIYNLAEWRCSVRLWLHVCISAVLYVANICVVGVGFGCNPNLASPKIISGVTLCVEITRRSVYQQSIRTCANGTRPHELYVV